MKMKNVFAVVAVAAIVLVGCSDDDSGSESGDSTTTTAKGESAECAARSDLQSSVKALADPSLLTGGKAGIESAVDDVKSDLDEVKSTTKDANQSDVDATKTAVDDLEKAVKDLGDGSITANLTAIGNAIAKVGTTGGTLVSSLGADC
jgi:hypothetical protein